MPARNRIFILMLDKLSAGLGNVGLKKIPSGFNVHLSNLLLY